MAWRRLIVLYLDGRITYCGRQGMTARSNNGEYSILRVSSTFKQRLGYPAPIIQVRQVLKLD